MFEPHRCSFTLRHEDPEGFFQGRNLTGPADVALISVSRVRTYAESLGYVTGVKHSESVSELDVARARVAALEAEVAEWERRFQAIDVLASAGFVERKKPGRKPAERTEVTA